MSTEQPRQTLADYVAIAISPVLIMALVGSLIFFLLEVFYVGDYQARLQWILFFYVFGVVLIARISMQQDIASRAGMYGIVLGALTWLALLLYVEYPSDLPLSGFGWAVNLGLIALSWWCAHKLTWDCTFIDDEEEASGQGLLQAAGLDPDQSKSENPEPPPEEDAKPKETVKVPAWDHYFRSRDSGKRKPHTPGVWVVYFSLAALPIFGIGQALIPVEETARRRYVFWLMVIYVASGLGLLLTTCFLGLRRYLRQRKLQMPAAMTGAWLTVGGTMIAVLLVVGALLPRPSAEYAVVNLPGRLGSPEREASKYATKGDSPGKGEGKGSDDSPKKSDEKGKPGSSGQRDEKGGAGKSNDPQDKSGDQQSQNKQDKQNGEQGKSEPGKGKGESSKGEPSKGESSKGKPKDGSGQADSQGGGSNKTDDASNKDPSSGKGQGSQVKSRSSSPSSPTGLMAKLSSVFKWIVYGLLALAALYVLLRFGWTFLKHLANFSTFIQRLVAALQNLWQSLFGWLGGGGSRSGAGEEESVETVVLRPFATYHNPFLDGRSEQLSPDELVRYSFEALQAWAREAGLAREAGETPLEFVERISGEVPALDADARRLTALYIRVAYARASLAPAALAAMRQFWEQLTAVEERPLSAGVGED